MTASTPPIPLVDQVREVGREIGLRKAVYPGFVARQKMTQLDADQHLAKMEAAYATLKWLQSREGMVKELVKVEAAVPALADKKTLVLWFPTDADRDEFVKAVREAKPGMISRAVPEPT